jgi:hypothetical protein
LDGEEKMNKECRNCGDVLNSQEKEYGWGDTCFPCVKENAGEEELFYLE